MLEHLFASIWNGLAARREPRQESQPSLDVGFQVIDGVVTRKRASVSARRRAEHAAVVGKTGTGKSSLLKYWIGQDIRDRNAFICIDQHCDLTPFILRRVASEAKRTKSDLSRKLIIIEPGDPAFSVGLNVLEAQDGQQNYVQLAEFAAILKARWGLDHFGPRTEELLRNSLHVLADCGETLLALGPLLTNAAFRAACVRQTKNPEVVSYFRDRFDPRSEAMQSVYREAILNKVSGFVTDQRFRHIVGQQKSTFSLLDAMDQGKWVVVNLDKGRLGPQAATLGSLILTKLKNALFARQRRELFTIYADEIQNLLAYDDSFDTLLSESRKYGIGVVTANQYLAQYPPQMLAAVMAIGTHAFFQLSSADADKMASALDGGKHLAAQLKSLPKRRLILRTGSAPPVEVLVPEVSDPQIDSSELYNACRERWARPRADIEADIQRRYRKATKPAEEVLDGWE